MTILDGKATAAEVRAEVAAQVQQIYARSGRVPGLAVVVVGDDPASQVYVHNKEMACAEVGILSRTVRMPATATTTEVLTAILALNADPSIDAIIVQLPLPPQCDAHRLQDAIDPAKDVDGLGAVQQGYLAKGGYCALTPCTPTGVVALLQRYGIALEGKHAVVVGRSALVGKPLAGMLLAHNATVTLCHSHTADLPAVCRSADILCVAVGKPHLVGAEWVKEGAVVVDIGIKRLGDRLQGDVDFDAVAPRCSYISPVPGGVGPMTVAILLANTVRAYQLAHES